jgi:hypothetical protein
MKPDPKPTLGPAGISANIAHLESRVQTAHDLWQSELNALQYWLDQLEQLEYQEVKDGF